MIAALLAAALAAIPHVPPTEQEPDAATQEQVSDEAYKAAKLVCTALRHRDPQQVSELLAPGFRARGLGEVELDGNGFASALLHRLDSAAVIRRCKFKPFEFTTDKAHARAVAKLALTVDGLEREGRRYADSGDVEALLVRDGKVLRFASMELGPRRFTAGGAPEFTDVTRALGIDPNFQERGEQLTTVFGSMNSGGVAVGDYDGDGLLDIFVVRDGQNQLWRNEGNGHFTDVTKQAGLTGIGNGRGALFADLDNDGDLDLFVTTQVDKGRPQGNRLYRNNGNGTFTDITKEAGVGQIGQYTSVVAADVDGDGLLDLYVTQYQSRKIQPKPQLLDAHNGNPNLLLHNLGKLHFVDVAKEAGVAGREWSFAAQFADLDGDRKPDLVVVNDWGSPILYKNVSTRGHVKFDDVTKSAGLVDPGNGMGVDIADYDGDGRPDIHLSKMYSTAGNRLLSQALQADPRWTGVARQAARGNSLFHNDGDFHFTEVGDAAGIRRGGWAWSCAWGDVDDDGRPDLIVSNGFHTGPLEDDL